MRIVLTGHRSPAAMLKTVVGLVLALVLVAISTPSASAACNPPKSISTYNGATGQYTYWQSTLAAQNFGGTLFNKFWNGGVDYTGSCQFVDFGAAPGDIGMYGSFGDFCLPGPSCPSDWITVEVTVVSGGRQQILVTKAPETHGGFLSFDFSNSPHSLCDVPCPVLTNLTANGTERSFTLSVGSVTACAYDGSATDLSGWNIVSKASARDPGISAGPYSVRTFLPAPGGGAASGTATVDCSNPALAQWVSTQLMTTAGGSPTVCPAIRVGCEPPSGTDLIRGPLILQETQTGTLNTSNVPGITTLTPFGSLVPNPVVDYPAGLELLTTDSLHVYQLTRSGVVSSYDASGLNTPVSTIAPPSPQIWMDMATDPTTGIVYGVAARCNTASTLHTLNLTAGTSVQLGSITNSTCMTGLAFDNGGNLFGNDAANNSLISINKVTGAGTIVGNLGSDVNTSQSMDCDPATGTCYLFSYNSAAGRRELRSVNLATGASTFVNTIGSVAPGGFVTIAGAVFGTFGSCTMDSQCSDNNACDGVETCINTQCQPGTPINCDDGLFCTIDSCDPASGSCGHNTGRCADADPCTIDSCNEANDSCTNTPLLQIRVCNQTPITIPTIGQATPYPVPINVSGLPAAAALCSVELRGITHTYPADLDILLSGPTGASPNAVLMSDVGAGTDVSGINLVLTDAAPVIPVNGPLVSGTFQPTNAGSPDAFPAPAPTPSGQTTLAQWFGLNLNGAWSLWVNDDASSDGGSLSGGWCLNIAPLACATDTDCDDHNPCNGVESCFGNVCQPGTQLNCDDGLFCTVDACSPSTGCTHSPRSCADTDDCTGDRCDEAQDSCLHVSECIEYCNQAPIVISNGPVGRAAPYPSNINVAGASTSAVVFDVKLKGITHVRPDAMDILLVGPNGQNAIIMSDAGGGPPAANGVNLVLTDAAAASLPDNGPLVSGTFRPTNFTSNDFFFFPAPTPTGGSALSAFDNQNPTGTWSLYVVGDEANFSATIADGWCVNLRPRRCSQDSECVDANPCNGVESCVNAICQPGTPTNCDDGVFCTFDSCDPTSGACAHSAGACADSDPCTIDTCDEANDTCTHTPLVAIRFCNPASITIPLTGQATPYPSTITVSGLPATAALCSVELNGITHTFPADIDVLLNGPTGASPNAIILSDTGSQFDVAGVNLVLNDGASASLHNGEQLVSGTYQPTNLFTGDVFPAPAPTPSGQSALAQWSGLNPNGAWKLWVNDDSTLAGDAGSISNGWCLNIAPLECNCDDGNPCNGLETCANGGCQPGAPVNCDDGNVCTDDSCNPASGCVHANNTIPCDDGNACTTGDTCGGSVCNPGPLLACNDDNSCTSDLCDPSTGCYYVSNTGPCDDGSACTKTDRCVAPATCVITENFDLATPPALPNGWTTSSSGSGIIWKTVSNQRDTPPNSALGDASNPAIPLSPGDELLLSPPIPIYSSSASLSFRNRWSFESSPAFPCTDAGVLEIKIGGGSFRDIVTAGGSFVSGGYTGTVYPPSGNPLAGRPAWCDRSAGWPGYLTTVVSLPAAAAGRTIQLRWRVGLDLSVSTGGGSTGLNIDTLVLTDSCAAPICQGTPLSCDDGNVCTDDSCNPASGCVHTNNTNPCDDGNACTTGDTCGGGICNGGPPPNCDDGDVCTDDSCNPSSGCVHTNNTNPCNDGNACTTIDACGGGTCNGGPPPNCDDGNVCTDDSCNPASGCVHTNTSNPCNDGNACTTIDTCGGGTCNGGPPRNCDDGECCTVDSCNPSTGCVHSANPTAPTFTTQPSLGACPVLWPPEHGYVDFAVAQTGAAATSQCPIASIQFASCTSSQGENAVGTGDGNSVRDCVYTGSTLSLRAERNGACSPLGRVYSTRLVATDVCGHTVTSDPLEVSVWHDRGHPPASTNVFHADPGSNQNDTRSGANGAYAAEPDACGTGSSCANGTVPDHSDADPEMEISQQAATSVNDLRMNKVNGSLELSWTMPEPYASINVTRFHIYRLDPVTFLWTYIAELTRHELSYTDPSMNDGRTWQYKVTAIIK
jgi:hypothetical protein